MFETNFTTLGLTLGRTGKKRNHTKFWWGNTFVKRPFEDQEQKERIPIKWILGGLKSVPLCDPCIQTDTEIPKPTAHGHIHANFAQARAHIKILH